MNHFCDYTLAEVVELIREANLKWDYSRSGDLDYLREYASKHFFPVGKYGVISSINIKREHDNYKHGASELLKICPKLYAILLDWRKTSEQYKSTITNQMKKDFSSKYNNVIKKLEQQECVVMVVGDTGAGKSSLINMILEERLVRTAAIKTTFVICEIYYSTSKKYSVAETQTSPFVEQPYSSLSNDALTTTHNRSRFDHARERYGCPIDLLKNGIIIADSPGLNESETLTKLVQTYMTDCLVFICVINCGVTDSLKNLLNELKAAGRTSAKSIFFVVTHLDDKELNEQKQALDQIYSDLGQLYEDFDPKNNCCVLNPSKALKIYLTNKVYEPAHYEFLQNFIPFLSSALKIKLQSLFDEIYEIFKRLDETVHLKHKQSLMESSQYNEISQRIIKKKQKFDAAKDGIITKIRPLSTDFHKNILATILEKSENRTFKNTFEQYAVSIELPSPDSRQAVIGDLQFKKKNDQWCILLTKNDASQLSEKFGLPLEEIQVSHADQASHTTQDKSEYTFHPVQFGKMYCHYRLSIWIQKQMTPVLEEKTREMSRQIWDICRNDLQAIGDQIAIDYQELMNGKDEKYTDGRIRERHTTLLEQITNCYRLMNMSGFLWKMLSMMKGLFRIPLPVETLTDWFKGMTFQALKKNENSFKLKVAQHFYPHFIKKLKQEKKDLDKDSEQLSTSQHSLGASFSSTSDSVRAFECDPIVISILNTFEEAYTEMQQLTETVQTKIDAEKWEKICTTYIDKLDLLNHLFDNFHAIHLLDWPLKPNQVSRETNVLSSILYDGCDTYNGKLTTDDASFIPVHIHQLKNRFSVLNIHNQCETLAITNNSQHILHCYGVYLESSTLFLVTEPIHSNLERLLSDANDDSLATDKRIQMALELAQCIQYLHREKIFVNYIHPKSIKITSDQHVKLNVIGEERDFVYISPESLLQHQNIPLFYDNNIYAFGLILYRLFHTNRNEIELFHSKKWLLPSVDNIDATDISETYYIDYIRQNRSSMEFQIPKINSAISETIKNLIRLCCSVDAQKRPDINVIISILSHEKLLSANQISSPSQNNKIKHYGLLSIDGGGSRGIIATKIMEILELKIGKPLWTVFDFAGGSSTGGLLVLSSFQRRTPANELTELYKKLSSKIFPFTRAFPTTRFPHAPLEKELEKHFLDLKLTATNTSPKLFVVTKRATETQPYLLRNYDVTPTDDNSFHQGCFGWYCRDAARATTAAPTYFTALIKDGTKYSDGGVGFNNPVQLVFEEALSSLNNDIHRLECTPNYYHFPIAYIVSVGTGTMPSLRSRVLPRTPVLRGLARVINVAEMLTEQATECENAHLAMNIASNRYGIPYFRFNTPLPERTRMDLGDETDLNKLIELTNEYMNTESVQMNIEKLCKLIHDKQD